MKPKRKLIDDCFVHDSQRMRHGDVLALLAERLSPVVDTETVPLAQLAGRVAAESVEAAIHVPQSDNAAVDGFAFAHASYMAHRGELTIAGRIAAGDSPTDAVTEGACVRIFTGAPVPESADTVAMEEDCSIASDGKLRIPDGLKPGANRRRAGEDFKPGDLIVRAGQRLRPQDLAALAANGYDKIAVHERLRIAILSTGDEIVQPGRQTNSAQVYDANRPMLMSLAASATTRLTDLGHVGDDPDLLRQTIADAASEHDLIITSGGASRGEEDHMRTVLDTLGKRHLWQIAVKPGRPMMFGQIGDTVLVGLPGNPVAVLVCFALYARAVIGHLSGAFVEPPIGYPLPAAFEIARKKTERREFLRAWAAPDPETGRMAAHKFPRDGSGLVSGLQAATGLIELAEDVASVARGDRVRFIPFAELSLSAGSGSAT